MSKDAIELLRDAIRAGHFGGKNDFDKLVRDANRPVYEAFVNDLLALMHRYGIYWHPAGHPFGVEDLAYRNIEIGFDGHNVRCDSDGDLTNDHGSEGFPIVQVKPPTAHQKMEQVAFRRSILAKAEGGAE